MNIPKTIKQNGIVYTYEKSYDNFILYRNKLGIPHTVKRTDLLESYKNQQENKIKAYNKSNLIKKLYRLYGEILSKDAIKDIVRENDAEKAEQIAKLLYEDEKYYN